jgi:outer membrane protein TolC
MANAQEVKYLKDAITYALENKSDAKKARLKVENKYQIQEVRSRALPKITANGGLTYNPILQTTFLMQDLWR